MMQLCGSLLAIFCVACLCYGNTKVGTNQNRYYKYCSSELGTYNIRYRENDVSIGEKSSTSVLFLHGFGGNADQFRKNMDLVGSPKTYALDLLGYGYSDKPSPKAFPRNELYSFNTWSDLVTDFITNVIEEPTILCCNSIGGIVGLQAAVDRPDLIKGIILVDVSLRLLHNKKQNPLFRPLVSVLQSVLRDTPIGAQFFNNLLNQRTIKNILTQAYASNVDDETVEIILRPGFEDGAAEVFLDFIADSGGPLPEELLEKLEDTNIPVRILWGKDDPWEPITLGRELAKFGCVDEFIELPGAGHCPMDQIPDVFNAEISTTLAAWGN